MVSQKRSTIFAVVNRVKATMKPSPDVFPEALRHILFLFVTGCGPYRSFVCCTVDPGWGNPPTSPLGIVQRVALWPVTTPFA